MRWQYLNDAIGRATLQLVRRLLKVRRQRAELRSNEVFFSINRSGIRIAACCCSLAGRETPTPWWRLT
jgi:hypothetical protein